MYSKTSWDTASRHTYLADTRFWYGSKNFQVQFSQRRAFFDLAFTRLLIGFYNKTKIHGFEINGMFFAKLTVSHEVLLYIKIATNGNMSVTKFVLLITYQSVSAEFCYWKLSLKMKNCLIWWLVTLFDCQIWKNPLASINEDLKDYLILGASLGNVFLWSTLGDSPLPKSSATITTQTKF